MCKQCEVLVCGCGCRELLQSAEELRGGGEQEKRQEKDSVIQLLEAEVDNLLLYLWA